MADATFGMGCFWSPEELFRETPGVTDTEVGFTGGHLEDPTYKDVCGGNTGHAEAVHITFDPTAISYEELLDLFWSNHNPTTKNRQGPDIGDQYRSAIFYHSQEQKAAAEKSLKERDASGKFGKPIVTEIAKAGPFYRAEEYHQCFYQKKENPFM